MFSITVRSEKEDKRIPIAVASDVMFDIQLLLTHIGESLIAEEFGGHDRPCGSLTERFTLFIDPDSGISYRTSAGKGKSALMDKAASMLISVLDKMGSGSGTYWMEDNFKDPRYRYMVLYDLIHLSKHMNTERGYTLLFSSGDNERTFVPMDIEKFGSYLKKDARTSQGYVSGVLNAVHTKRNVSLYGFVNGDSRAKISFISKDVENEASKYVNNAVIVNGMLKYSDDGELLEIRDISSVIPFNIIKFKHMISAARDVKLNESIEVPVSYDSSAAIWKLNYPDLGITVSNKEWDLAVAEFHDYFVFLCDNYLTDEEKELSDEEKEVKDILSSITANS